MADIQDRFLNFEVITADRLEDHPLSKKYADKDVEKLTGKIRTSGQFHPIHALLVRKIGKNEYQILSGHKRKQAALKNGIKLLPCRICEDMSDKAALLEYTKHSVVREDLSPVEHGLRVIAMREAGLEGVVVRYARLMGKTHSYVLQLMQAAEVFLSAGDVIGDADMSKKAMHLKRIKVLPEELWPLMVGKLAEDNWTKKETAPVSGMGRQTRRISCKVSAFFGSVIFFTSINFYFQCLFPQKQIKHKIL